MGIRLLEGFDSDNYTGYWLLQRLWRTELVNYWLLQRFLQALQWYKYHLIFLLVRERNWYHFGERNTADADGAALGTKKGAKEGAMGGKGLEKSKCIKYKIQHRNRKGVSLPAWPHEVGWSGWLGYKVQLNHAHSFLDFE